VKMFSLFSPDKHVDAFLAMSREQQELFMSLLPNWYFPVEELLDAVKALSD